MAAREHFQVRPSFAGATTVSSLDRTAPGSSSDLSGRVRHLDEKSVKRELSPKTGQLPASLRLIYGLDWSGITHNRLTGHLVFGRNSQDIEIYACQSPVLHLGTPCAAIVFMGSDPRTRLVVTRRLMRMLSDIDCACQTLRTHESGNADIVGAIVMTVSWHQREAATAMLLATIESDQALLRMVLRSSADRDLAEYDGNTLRTFAKGGGGVSRHFTGPHILKYRFSDFRLIDEVRFGVGTRFALEFDDHELMDLAVGHFVDYLDWKKRRHEPVALSIVTSRAPASTNGDTDFLWGDLSLVLAAGMNKPAVRVQMIEFLRRVCCLDGSVKPLSEALLSEGAGTDMSTAAGKGPGTCAGTSAAQAGTQRSPAKPGRD